MKARMTLVLLGLLLSGCELKRRMMRAENAESLQNQEGTKRETPQEQSSEEEEEAEQAHAIASEHTTIDSAPAAAPVKRRPHRAREKVVGNSAGARYYRTALTDVAAKDPESAAENYYKSCEAGYIAGCHRYAWHKEQQGDRRLAEEYYRRACDGGYAKSCNNLGYWTEKSGKWHDAQNWYSWACLKGHPGSCANLKRVNDKAKASAIQR